VRRKIAVAALCALAVMVGAAWAVTDTQDGQSTRGVQQARLGGMLVRADSTMDAFTSDGSHRLQVAEGTPISSITVYYPDFYGGTAADTMSMHGRTMDSTSVLSVVGYTRVSHMLKMEGHHGAAGNAVSIAVTALCSFGTTTNDTTMTFPLQASGHFQGVTLDSLVVGSPVGDATAHTTFARIEHRCDFLTHSAIYTSGNTTRARVLEFTLPAGARSIRFIYRLIADEATAPTQGAKFKLRTSIGLSAL
jgi:hypothetical protein